MKEKRDNFMLLLDKIHEFGSNEKSVKAQMKEFNFSTYEDVEDECFSLEDKITTLAEKLAVQSEVHVKEVEEEDDSPLVDPFAPETTMSHVNQCKGRVKRALEAITMHAIPAAVQAQMIASNPNEMRLSEVKFKKLWLQSIRHRLARVIKQRAQRQSKLELAAEFGLRPNQSETVNTSEAYNNNRTITERRRAQLERIRAMTAELNASSAPKKAKNSSNSKSSTSKTKKKKAEAKKEEPPPDETGLNGDIDVEDVEFTDPLSACLADDEANSNMPLLSQDDPLSVQPKNNNADRAKQQQRKKSFMEILEEDADGNVSEQERDQQAVFGSILALYDPDTAKDVSSQDYEVNLEDYYTIRVETELLRSAELLFQPGLIGEHSAGVGECLHWVLKDSSRQLQSITGETTMQFIPEAIFLQGGVSQLKGLEAKMRYELQQILPYDGDTARSFQVHVSDKPSIDAWKGAANYVQACDSRSVFLSHQQYLEFGPEYFIEHQISNRLNRRCP